MTDKIFRQESTALYRTQTTPTLTAIAYKLTTPKEKQ
jgi:hypothetical protein